MENFQDPDQIDQDLKELQDLIAETEEELAASKERPGVFTRPNAGRIAFLTGVASEILDLIHKKTREPKEVIFITNMVKAAIDYWRQGDSAYGRR